MPRINSRASAKTAFGSTQLARLKRSNRQPKFLSAIAIKESAISDSAP